MPRLLAKADPATRLVVARKLARHPTTPPRVLEMIEEMGGEGALYLLECAPLMRDRLVAAASGDESRACALARRVDLDAELTAVLSLRPEPAIALALAANGAAPIGAQIAVLARRAEREKPLAAALLSRVQDDTEAASLFLLASSDQRASILAAAQRSELARVGVDRQAPDHAASIVRLEQHALARQPELFVNLLAEALGCSRDLAGRIAGESSGEPLAVALKALDAPQGAAVRILISGNLQSGANYAHIGSLIRLTGGLSPAAAQRVVAALIGAPKDRRALHQPVFDPGASATPSRPASVAAQIIGVSAEAIRRQRAFAFAANGQRIRR
jgi:uncharacterized protein (DUF2336 family)